MPQVTYRIIIDAPSVSKRAAVVNNTSLSADVTNSSADTPATNGMSAKTYGLFEVGQHIGKTLLNYGKNSIEMYTGNGVLQSRVNTAFQTIGYAALIAANPLLGVATMAVNIGLQAATRAWEMKWENKASAEQQRRSGNFLTGGGRK